MSAEQTMGAEQPSGDAVVTEDPSTRLYLAVGRLSRSLRRNASHGLGHGSVSALATLVRGGPMRLGDLAAREGVAAPTLSRMITSLVEAGYVAREPDPADGRARTVTATESGRSVVQQMRGSRTRDLGGRLQRLPAEQRAALYNAIDALETLATDDPAG